MAFYINEDDMEAKLSVAFYPSARYSVHFSGSEHHTIQNKEVLGKHTNCLLDHALLACIDSIILSFISALQSYKILQWKLGLIKYWWRHLENKVPVERVIIFVRPLSLVPI